MSDLITTRTSQLAWTVLDADSPGEPSRASLVLQWGEAAEVVQLSGQHDAVVVGRSQPSDVCVSSPSLSRQHARFRYRDGDLWVEDLSSLNGTVIGGQRVKEARLRAGDQVVLGDVTVHISLANRSSAQQDSRRGPADQKPADPALPPTDDVVKSPAMARLYGMARKLAAADVSVLITGETGTGKEHLARALHDLGPRADKPFRVVNCGAIPEALAESLLFGHERGAFTGANQRRAGVFEDAGNGTVFLDEIGELPLGTQAKLLRVLETRELTRVGGHRTIPLGMRVIAATHCDLERMVGDRTFRQDLLYRLNTVGLAVPPLRERQEEIPLLAERFVRMACDTWGLPACAIEPEARSALVRYAWPGNIRHLRNTMERAALLCRDGRIALSDLPEPVRAPQAAEHPSNSGGADPGETPGASEHNSSGTPATPPNATDAPFKDQVQALELRLIRDALAQTGGNHRAAAKLLRMPRRTLAYKVKSLGIDAPDGAES